MSDTTIDFMIDEDGHVSMHVQGQPGSKCLDITGDVEKELGDVVGRKFTSEYTEKKQDVKLNWINNSH